MPVPQRTPCPISRKDFRLHAQPIAIQVNGSNPVLEVKEFSTNSLGWYYNGKITIEVNGVKVPCTANIQLIISNSKELPL